MQVYIGTSSGAETLQGSSTGNADFNQTTRLTAGTLSAFGADPFAIGGALDGADTKNPGARQINSNSRQSERLLFRTIS